MGCMGIFRNIPKAIFYLLKGDHRITWLVLGGVVIEASMLGCLGSLGAAFLGVQGLGFGSITGICQHE